MKIRQKMEKKKTLLSCDALNDKKNCPNERNKTCLQIETLKHHLLHTPRI